MTIASLGRSSGRVFGIRFEDGPEGPGVPGEDCVEDRERGFLLGGPAVDDCKTVKSTVCTNTMRGLMAASTFVRNDARGRVMDKSLHSGELKQPLRMKLEDCSKGQFPFRYNVPRIWWFRWHQYLL